MILRRGIVGRAAVNERARALWARARCRVWPRRCWLVSLAKEHIAEAAALIAGDPEGFGALLVERDEVSLTVSEDLWKASGLRSLARAEAGPFRALSLDIDLDLTVVGFLAPLAQRLAEEGVSIVPQSGYLKDHLLVREEQLELTLQVVDRLIESCRG